MNRLSLCLSTWHKVYNGYLWSVEALCNFINFLVVWSIDFSSSLVHFRKVPEYLTMNAVHDFTPLTSSIYFPHIIIISLFILDIYCANAFRDGKSPQIFAIKDWLAGWLVGWLAGWLVFKACQPFLGYLILKTDFCKQLYSFKELFIIICTQLCRYNYSYVMQIIFQQIYLIQRWYRNRCYHGVELGV